MTDGKTSENHTRGAAERCKGCSCHLHELWLMSLRAVVKRKYNPNARTTKQHYPDRGPNVKHKVNCSFALECEYIPYRCMQAENESVGRFCTGANRDNSRCGLGFPWKSKPARTAAKDIPGPRQYHIKKFTEGSVGTIQHCFEILRDSVEKWITTCC